MYFGHSRNSYGIEEPLIDHLKLVSDLSFQYAEPLKCSSSAAIIGLFHDLGKRSTLFQHVLTGETQNVDHSTAGAYAVLKAFQVLAWPAAIIIKGHHGGLKQANKDWIQTLFKCYQSSQEYNEEGKAISVHTVQAIEECLKWIFEQIKTQPRWEEDEFVRLMKNSGKIPQMLYIRMLFSVLVDADYTATESHMLRRSQTYELREPAPALSSEKMFSALMEYRNAIKKKSTSADDVNDIRNQLFDDCILAANQPKGIFTITAPTGAGKTLAMLGFAVKHASFHGMKRIIFVLPYLSIIEQNARIYEEIIQTVGDGQYVLQDHSQTQYSDDDSRFYSQRWEAPVIVTTSVKFFESLFSADPCSCRKLHHIAQSVIIFDEAQSLPPELGIPTTQALGALDKSIFQFIWTFNNIAIICNITLSYLQTGTLKQASMCPFQSNGIYL